MPLNIPASNIVDFWDVLRTSNTFLGCSVTYPHRQSASAQLDMQLDIMTASATRLDALNTVRRADDGSLCGDATDRSALLRAIDQAGVCVSGAWLMV